MVKCLLFSLPEARPQRCARSSCLRRLIAVTVVLHLARVCVITEASAFHPASVKAGGAPRPSVVTSISAVTVENRRAPTQANSGGSTGRHVERVVHLTCFDDRPDLLIDTDVFESSQGDDANGGGGGLCCRGLATALRSACAASRLVPGDPLAASAAPVGRGFCRDFSRGLKEYEDDWTLRCAERIAEVPSDSKDAVDRRVIVGDGGGDVSRPLRARYYLAEPVFAEREPATDLSGRAAGVGRFAVQYAAVESAEGGGGRYEGVGGRWYSDAPSPFRLSPSFLRLLHRDEGGQKFSELKSPSADFGGILNGSFSSILFADGGMHRRYQHTLMLSIPSVHVSTSSHTMTRLSGTAFIFLPLSEGVYIDADEPFQDSEGRCKVMELMGGKDGSCDVAFVQVARTAIDIEQPSFASPQYVVAFSISFSTEANGELRHAVLGAEGKLGIHVEFSNSLHVRYQLPISEETTVKDVFIPVYVPNLILDSAEIRLEAPDQMANKVYLFHGESEIPEEEISNDSTLQSAAGFNADYWPVALITMLSSILGAYVMIRDLSQISIWL